VARSKVASAVKVMDQALAGKWICRMHPGVVKDHAGDCDICGMPLVRTETLGYLGVSPTEADKPLVIPVSAALRTGTRAVVYVQIDPSLLRLSSVRDWPKLLGRVRAGLAGSGAGGAAVSFWKRLSADLGRALLATPAGQWPRPELQHAFVREANAILRRADFADPETWKSIDLPAEARALMAAGAERLSPMKRTRLNRLLLEALFPDGITQSRNAPTFEGREIVLGPRAKGYYLVRRGLAAGQRVVTKGAFKIDAELQIQAKPSMMTPEGGGGGYHHGGNKPAEKGDNGKMKMRLPAVVRGRLHEVVAAGKKIHQAVQAGDTAAIRGAFAAFEQKLKAVRKDGLEGHAGLLWKEYSMLLGNDALEGREVKDLADARHVAKVTAEHLASMRAKLGLGSFPKQVAAGKEFQAQFAKVVEGYLAIQKALVADDADRAAAGARQAMAGLAAVDMKLLEGDAHLTWMKTSSELKKILTGVVSAAGIEPVRREFALLSEAMMVAVRRFGAPGGPLYQFKCPMAFNKRGATWLQRDDQTRNPYFGAVMLQCGNVIEVVGAADGGQGAEEKDPPDE